MSFYMPTIYNKDVNLQSTLSAATAGEELRGEMTGLHHPITCTTGELSFDEDNTMSCPHSSAPASNPRNQAILDATIAILIFQEVDKKFH